MHDVLRWLRWHRAELTAVGVPAAAAVTVSPWCLLGSAVTAAWWAVQEHRHRPPAPQPPDDGVKRDERRETA